MPQYHATILLNVGIIHISGIIFIRAIKNRLPKIRMARQDNITQGGTYPGRTEKGKGYTHTHTHTYDINYPTLLLRNIQITNTKCTPCKHRSNVKATQDLHRIITALKP